MNASGSSSMPTSSSKPRGETLRQALHAYFDANGFGPDGGYTSDWVDFKIGPVPLPFPNTSARKRAVRFHDLHHLVTGYATDFPGEMEISAWEIGSGCKREVAAWQLNLGAMATGALFMPGKTWRAFLRGRRSCNFYGRPYDEALLSTTVEAARAELGVPDKDARHEGTLAEAALFGVATATGLVVGTTSALVASPFMLAAAVAGVARKLVRTSTA